MTLPLSSSVRTTPSRVLLVAAFAAVYLIWGSTYLAIRIAVETVPPFLLGAVRFLVAGGALFGVLALRGVTRPTPRQWWNCSVAGAIMLVGGNGLVNWAEQRVPSSTAALFIASAPVWFALFDWLRPGGSRPGWVVWLGVFTGLAGVALLVLRSGPHGSAAALDGAGAMALLVATMCWAGGSTLARLTPRPDSPWMAAAVQMLAGGTVMLVIAGARGEMARFDVRALSLSSLAAVGYLIVFGSWIAFSAYVWLLEVSTPARVSTYAYVNPVVAVLLGWILLGEIVTPRMGIAAAVIVAAVGILTWPRARPT